MGLVLGVLISVAATPVPRDDVRRAVDSIYSDADIQRDLPAPAAPHDEPRVDRTIHFGPIAYIILWVVVAAAGLLVVVWAINEFVLGPRAPPPPEVSAEAAAIESARAELEAPRADAEALAAAGRFAEAIHALLFLTLDELVRAGTRAIPAALTAREICRRVAMPEGARGELAGLVSAVEVSHFGSRAPTAADYEVCRQRFDRFVAGYRGGA